MTMSERSSLVKNVSIVQNEVGGWDVFLDGDRVPWHLQDKPLEITMPTPHNFGVVHLPVLVDTDSTFTYKESHGQRLTVYPHR